MHIPIRKTGLPDKGFIPSLCKPPPLHPSNHLMLNDLSLDSDPQRALDGTCWLAPNGQVGGTSSTSDSASAAVEQDHLHVVLLGDCYQLLLRLEEGPGGRQTAGVLPGVRVA